MLIWGSTGPPKSEEFEPSRVVHGVSIRFRTIQSSAMWVVVKIMVPFWVPIIIRHLLFRVPKKGPSF